MGRTGLGVRGAMARELAIPRPKVVDALSQQADRSIYLCGCTLPSPIYIFGHIGAYTAHSWCMCVALAAFVLASNTHDRHATRTEVKAVAYASNEREAARERDILIFFTM